MKLFLLFLLLVGGAKAQALGFGHDLITCRQNDAPNTQHLDFTLSAGLGYEIATTRDPLRRVQDLLENRTGYLGQMFARYLGEMGSEESPQYWRWRNRDFAAAAPLPADERQLLPANCDAESATTVAQLDFRESMYWVHYDAAAWEDLKSDPLQFSFAVLHEFLWYYSHDRGVIRLVNRYLHSTAAEGPYEYNNLEMHLVSLGLNVGFESQSIVLPVGIEATTTEPRITFDRETVPSFRPNPSTVTNYIITNNTLFRLMMGDTWQGGDYQIIEPGASHTFFGYFNRGGWISAVIYDEANWPAPDEARIFLPVRDIR